MMSNRVFDNTENQDAVKPFRKDAHGSGSGSGSGNGNGNGNGGSSNGGSSNIKRVPLGGKNQNTNSLTLHRSKSNLTTPKFHVPRLTKSNSTLGIPSVSVLHERDTRVKRIQPLSESIRRPLKKQKPSDSLIKRDLPRKPHTEALVSTKRTHRLHSSHIKQSIIRNGDPGKQTQRSKEIDKLVELHWRDEIESILPEETKENADTSEIPNLFDESELIFSTPNNSHDAGELTIMGDEEPIGLSQEDLRNLLD
ncbi:hypothetical protein KGF56_002295 [Candida oxycetoniae]|uniref:Uncharacterized protein n=1 Tax=Candida oxycetoniae TaxID=497107 RepID=A0AAI9WYC3_9ASCO|nr:uncharacterized protein KGF56_002295 [Candida oxycetoniae]KAI3404879.2 hypothetical protein KGF56_002295 [Candida oxycetoniae]